METEGEKVTDTENEWFYEPEELKVFASYEEFLESDDMNGWVEGDKLRPWYKTRPELTREMIESGDAFSFQYKGNDYFIERGGMLKRGGLGYLIQDPRIGHRDDPYDEFPYTDYPGCSAVDTPDDMLALAFLDGKTIFERFDELRFFDGV